MGNKKYFKNNPVRIFDQMIALKASYLDAICEIKGDVLWWSGKIQPTELSLTYTVLMKFKMWTTPTVWVIGDELQKLDDPTFPHKYHIDEDKKMVEICLYRYREFNSYKYLAKTIIPWTIEWLYFYEIWLATGEWCGGGEHPSVGERKEHPKDETDS